MDCRRMGFSAKRLTKFSSAMTSRKDRIECIVAYSGDLPKPFYEIEPYSFFCVTETIGPVLQPYF